MGNNIQADVSSFWSFKNYSFLLMTIVFFVFANTLFNGYNFDDNLVTNHHALTSKGVKSIWKIFTTSYFTNNADITFGYRPITHLSFAIEHQFFGENTAISHFVNLLIYLVAVFNFFKILSNWFEPKSLQWAFLAALLFGIHPIHSEAVASIKNRDELLAFMFLTFSLLQLNKYVIYQSWRNVGIAAIWFALGLLSKKSIYPLVFVVPLILIYVQSLKLKTTIMVGFVFSVVAGIFGSDFIGQRMLLLFFAPMAFIAVLALFEIRNLILSWIYSKQGRTILEFVLLGLNLVGWGVSIYYEDYLFFLLASVFMAILLVQTNYKSIYLLAFSFQLVSLSFGLEIKVLSQIAFLLSSIVMIPLINKEKRDPILLFNFLLTFVFILLYKFSFGNLSLILSLLFVIYFSTKNKIFSAGALLVNLVVSFVFFRLNYFHLVIGITTFCLFGWHTIEGILRPKTRIELLLFLFLVPIAFFASTQKTAYQNFVDGLAVERNHKEIPTQINQSGTTEGEFSEGRSLSYVENTLIGNQTLEAKFTTGITTLGEYLRLQFFPQELLFYYGYAKVKTSSFSDGLFWFWLMVMVFLIVFVFLNFDKSKFLLIGFWWLIVSLLLFSNWVELVAGMVGERLAFTASAGFCLFLVSAIMIYKSKLDFKRNGIWEIGIILVILSFSGRTIARNADWKSPIILMEHDIVDLGESAYANHMYALTCMNELSRPSSKTQERQFELLNLAEQSLLKSVSIYPYYFNANFDLARLYIQKGEFGLAKESLDNCYKLDSNNLFVLEELAKTCFDLKLVNETVLYANKFLNRFPENENMYEILAYTLFLNKDYLAAKQVVERGLKHYPIGKNLRPLMLDIDRNSVLNDSIYR
jgi:hypothetical protein